MQSAADVGRPCSHLSAAHLLQGGLHSLERLADQLAPLILGQRVCRARLAGGNGWGCVAVTAAAAANATAAAAAMLPRPVNGCSWVRLGVAKRRRQQLVLTLQVLVLLELQAVVVLCVC